MTDNKRQTTLRLDADVLQAIRIECLRREISMNEQVNALIERWLAEEQACNSSHEEAA